MPKGVASHPSEKHKSRERAGLFYRKARFQGRRDRVEEGY